jgi:hypothetical protein
MRWKALAALLRSARSAGRWLRILAEDDTRRNVQKSRAVQLSHFCYSTQILPWAAAWPTLLPIRRCGKPQVESGEVAGARPAQGCSCPACVQADQVERGGGEDVSMACPG